MLNFTKICLCDRSISMVMLQHPFAGAPFLKVMAAHRVSFTVTIVLQDYFAGLSIRNLTPR